MVKLIEFFQNRRIQFCQRKELSVSQGCNNPRRNNTHRTLHERLILRRSRTGRNNRCPVVLCHLAVAAVQNSFILCVLNDAGFEIVRHEDTGNTAVEMVGIHMGIVDTDTGELIPAYLFVSVLPYSGYAYAEAFLDEKQEAWINAHVNAYRFYGGVTRILVPDNLKTGVIKNTKNETVLNRSYREMAEHYGTAVIPARPRTPKDKAFVEGSVGVVSTWVIAALRNRQFFSLAELNEAVSEKLYEFNHKPFQKKDGSRAVAFEEEKPFLLPLPAVPFELAMWKVATVQYNYHVSVDKQNYSVPYEYIKQKVDVRLTSHTVEVFFEGNRIASHSCFSFSVVCRHHRIPLV